MRFHQDHHHFNHPHPVNVREREGAYIQALYYPTGFQRGDGSLRYIKGSHRDVPELGKPSVFNAAPGVLPGQHSNPPADSCWEVEEPSLPPGSLVLINARMYHAVYDKPDKGSGGAGGQSAPYRSCVYVLSLLRQCKLSRCQLPWFAFGSLGLLLRVLTFAALSNLAALVIKRRCLTTRALAVVWGCVCWFVVLYASYLNFIFKEATQGRHTPPHRFTQTIPACYPRQNKEHQMLFDRRAWAEGVWEQWQPQEEAAGARL